MTLTGRDRKIALAIAPLLVVAAYWFLLMAPKREEAAAIADKQVAQEERRDAARDQLRAASGAKTDFAADYGEIVRLGKAIPAQVDMPSLLVQLDRAAEGTGITFTRVAAGHRQAAVVPEAPEGGEEGADSENTTPAAAGGEPAQSGAGTAAESANNAAAQSDQSNAASASAQSGVDPADTQTSTSAREGGLPVGGGAPAADGATGTGTAPPGLETVPLELEFVGDFFRLADFFHDVKRFVDVVSNNVVVNGRLVTIEGVEFASDPTLFPRIHANINATVYLSPVTQGVTAGATPQGPAAGTTPASSTPPASGGSSPAAPAPTAAVTP
jgi:Tfp pilus assembly protein PilO